MKIIAIGDIHGRDTWKEILEKEKDFDKVVFIGDYFDSFTIEGNEQIANSKEIVNLKEQHKDKVILLLGNHDIHYLIDEQYSGYNHVFSSQFMHLLNTYLDLFQIYYIHGKYLFSHAGISKVWMKNWRTNLKEVNDLWKHNKYAFGFQVGNNFSPYGDDVTQSPVWIRPRSLLECKLKSYIYIVGHTEVKNISLSLEKKLIMIDALERGQYLVIEDSKPKVESIK